MYKLSLAHFLRKIIPSQPNFQKKLCEYQPGSLPIKGSTVGSSTRLGSGLNCNQGILTEGGRLSTVDLLIKVVSFCKKGKKYFQLKKRGDLNQLVHGGQLYRAFPFSKSSLLQLINLLATNTLAYFVTASVTKTKKKLNVIDRRTSSKSTSSWTTFTTKSKIYRFATSYQ